MIEDIFGPDEIATMAALPTPADTAPAVQESGMTVTHEEPADLSEPYWLK